MKKIQERYEKKTYKEPQLKEIGSIIKETKSNNSGTSEDNATAMVRYS